MLVYCWCGCFHVCYYTHTVLCTFVDQAGLGETLKEVDLDALFIETLKEVDLDALFIEIL